MTRFDVPMFSALVPGCLHVGAMSPNTGDRPLSSSMFFWGPTSPVGLAPE